METVTRGWRRPHHLGRLARSAATALACSVVLANALTLNVESAGALMYVANAGLFDSTGPRCTNRPPVTVDRESTALAVLGVVCGDRANALRHFAGRPSDGTARSLSAFPSRADLIAAPVRIPPYGLAELVASLRNRPQPASGSSPARPGAAQPGEVGGCDRPPLVFRFGHKWVKGWDEPERFGATLVDTVRVPGCRGRPSSAPVGISFGVSTAGTARSSPDATVRPLVENLRFACVPGADERIPGWFRHQGGLFSPGCSGDSSLPVTGPGLHDITSARVSVQPGSTLLWTVGWVATEVAEPHSMLVWRGWDGRVLATDIPLQGWGAPGANAVAAFVSVPKDAWRVELVLAHRRGDAVVTWTDASLSEFVPGLASRVTP